MKRLIPVTVMLLVTLGLTASKADAAMILTLQQVGNDVVLSGSGTMNLAGFTPVVTTEFSPAIRSNAYFTMGAAALGTAYRATITGPLTIGAGLSTANPNIASGDLFGWQFVPTNLVVVPSGYTSGGPLSGSATFQNITLATMQVTPGVYNWSVPNGDTVQLTIGSPIPEPGTCALFGVGLGLAVLLQRTRRPQ